MRLLLFRLGLLTGSLGVSLLGAEWAVRAYERADHAARMAAFSHPVYEALDEAPYYVPRQVERRKMVVAKPGLPPTEWYFSINADRLRGPRFDAASATGTRVLFLGDSFTFGECVQREATFVVGVERLARAAGLDVTCVNAGIPGYNSEQAYAMLLRVFDSVRPHVVVLGYVANDAQSVLFVPRSPAYRNRYVRSVLFERSKPWLNAIGRIFVRDALLFASRELDGSNRYEASFAPDAVGWRDSRHYVHSMAQFCEARGVTFRVYVLPAILSPLDARHRFFFVGDAVCRWGRQLGFHAADLLPDFMGLDIASLGVPGDGHPNPECHRRMAESIFRRLRPDLE